MAAATVVPIEDEWEDLGEATVARAYIPSPRRSTSHEREQLDDDYDIVVPEDIPNKEKSTLAVQKQWNKGSFPMLSVFGVTERVHKGFKIPDTASRDFAYEIKV